MDLAKPELKSSDCVLSLDQIFQLADQQNAESDARYWHPKPVEEHKHQHNTALVKGAGSPDDVVPADVNQFLDGEEVSSGTLTPIQEETETEKTEMLKEQLAEALAHIKHLEFEIQVLRAMKKDQQPDA